MTQTISTRAMPVFSPKAALLLACLTGFAAPSGAEVLSATNPTIRSNLCIGTSCANDETFNSDFNQLTLKANNTRILFDDNSTTVGFPANDWSIQANDRDNGGEDQLMVIDEGTAAEILTIKAGAPTATMVLASDGRVGLGTELPQAPLHVETSTDTGIRINRSGGEAFDLEVDNSSNFRIRDVAGGTLPLMIRGGGVPSLAVDLTPTGIILNRPQAAALNLRYSSGDDLNAFFVEGDNGNVGIGTGDPEAPLEVSDNATFSFFRLTAAQAAVNQSVDVVFTQGPLGTGQLRYNIVDGDNQEMSLDANGNMILDGTLTTGGPSCAGGCDAVFTEEQIIPAEAYAAQMWADGHLPHVGPTAPGEAFNMTEKMGGMLNALEHAHIYIEGLHADVEGLSAEKAALERRVDTQAAQIAAQAAQLTALMTRLEALEEQN